MEHRKLAEKAVEQAQDKFGDDLDRVVVSKPVWQTLRGGKIGGAGPIDGTNIMFNSTWDTEERVQAVEEDGTYHELDIGPMSYNTLLKIVEQARNEHSDNLRRIVLPKNVWDEHYGEIKSKNSTNQYTAIRTNVGGLEAKWTTEYDETQIVVRDDYETDGERYIPVGELDQGQESTEGSEGSEGELDPAFGETDGDVRAEGEIKVTRQLNDFSGFREDFIFKVKEPLFNSSNRTGLAAAVEYKIGRNGGNSKELVNRRVPIQSIPEDVRERAKKMTRHMGFEPTTTDGSGE